MRLTAALAAVAARRKARTPELIEAALLESGSLLQTAQRRAEDTKSSATASQSPVEAEEE